MSDTELFFEHIGNILPTLKMKMRKFCQLTEQKWDEDVFSDTILKCAETIDKQRKLNDNSEQGIENYFFQSFQRNIKREKQYSRNSKRDNTSDIFQTYEDFQNKNELSQDEKIRQDLYKDFSVIYIMTKAEKNCDKESFHLFNLKTLGDYTYKELQEKCPQTKAIRQKCKQVKDWIKENITKEEINKAFNEFTSDF